MGLLWHTPLALTSFVRSPRWRGDIPASPHFVRAVFPLRGGIENATAKETLPEDDPVLSVNATVLFGALEIKD